VEPPLVVVLASILQLSLAATFAMMAAAAHVYGSDAQRAAELDVARQGVPDTVLAQHGVNFRERGAELALPIAIAVCLTALAVLNLFGEEVGRVLSWIVQPVLLVAGGIITAGQVFAARCLASAFEKSHDATLERIDVKSFVDAAVAAFPRGFRLLVASRFVLTTVGSALVIALLALHNADAYFR
jgi:hypothetical protein